MNKVNYTNLGGFPLDQDNLAFLQNSYSKSFEAIAKLCGNKTILHGVEPDGSGNITAGWISYNGELLPLIGGAVAPQVKITETVTAVIFEDNVSHNIEFVRVAQLVLVGGDFNFNELKPLLSLDNMLPKDTILHCMKDTDYIAANFDAGGYGTGPEKGWRKLSSAYPDAAGRVLINIAEADGRFDEAGKIYGEYAHTQTLQELASHQHVYSHGRVGGVDSNPNGGGWGYPNNINDRSTEYTGGGQPMNVTQPSLVVFMKIKL